MVLLVGFHLAPREGDGAQTLFESGQGFDVPQSTSIEHGAFRGEAVDLPVTSPSPQDDGIEQDFVAYSGLDGPTRCGRSTDDRRGPCAFVAPDGGRGGDVSGRISV